MPKDPISQPSITREQAPRTDRASGAPNLTRRAFLQQGGLVSASALAAPFTANAANNTSNSTENAKPSSAPQIRKRVPLGRDTGIEIPDISFGSFALGGGNAGDSDPAADERLVRHALERGITHFDTAHAYTEGRAEAALGRALKGRRQEVTLTSKFSANRNHSTEQQMEILEKSLRLLKTDYVDIYLNHAINDIDRLQDESWQRFGELAKQQGKIRQFGLSGHAGRLGDAITYALDENLIDVMLVAYNFQQQPSYKDRLKQYLNDWVPSLDIISGQPELPQLLERAHKQGVGVMVMKTLKGARSNDMRPYESPGRTFAQAAFRWVLSDPFVDGLVVTMTSPEQIDEYVEASGSGPPDNEDLALLARYTAITQGTSCTIGCGDCLDSCPAGVPIGDVLRMRMYDRDYGQPAIAAREYARLETDASACLGCSGLPCADACSSGIAISALTRDTERRLSQ
ncbi:MAG: aldo/keto reductase [Myxococcota bacterium]